MPAFKTGRLSNKEKAYIQDNAATKTDSEIAADLNRVVESVRDYREKQMPVDVPSRTANFSQNKYLLETRPYWSGLNQQFTKEELSLFVWYWNQMIGQFKEDVTPTEELQVIDVIKIEILINRAMADKTQCIREAERIDKRIEAEYSKDLEDQNVDFITSLESQMANIRATQIAKTDEFMKLEDKKLKLVKDLKGTRESRIQFAESSSQTFKALIEAINDEDKRRKFSIEVGIGKLAMEREYKRLGSPHEYIDNTIDIPVLSSETIVNLDKDEDE